MIAQNLNAMNLLWGFDFNPEIDVDGKLVPADTFAYKKVAMLLAVCWCPTLIIFV
jgi:hypothetical protein